MSLTKYTGATNTIQSLTDRPNQTEGLTAAAVKAKFDKAAIDMKAYVDDTLTVEIDTLDLANVKKTGNQTIEGVKTFESSPIVPTPTTDMQASTKKYNDDILTTHKGSNDHDGRYYTEAEVQALLAEKTALTGDHQGTWQGLTPTYADPGIAGVVAEHTSQLAENTQDISDLGTNKANKTDLDATNSRVTSVENNKADKSEVTNAMTPKGNSAYASLPTTGNTVGDYYYCTDGDGSHGAGNYVWNGTLWYFGGTGDAGYTMLKNDLQDYNQGYVFLVKDYNIPENADTLIDVSLDLSYDETIVVTNTGTGAAYYAIRVYADNVWTAIGVADTIVEAGQSLTLNIPITQGVFAYTKFNFKVHATRTGKVTAYKKANAYIDKMRSVEKTIIVDVNSTEGGVFRNIKDAIDYAKYHYDEVNENVLIYIKNGAYNLSPIANSNYVLNKGSNRISIKGESRDGVVITLNNTPALNNKVLEIGGPCIIENLTIKNLWTNDGSTGNWSHNAYCIHNDASFSSNVLYSTTIKNCYLYSEAFAPIGAGLQNNQKQRYIDCVFEFNSLDATPGGYNQWAPLYVHGPSNPASANCSLEIDNCVCLARKGTMAIVLPNVADSLQYTDIPVSIRRTVGVTNGATITNVSKATHALTTDSCLNNVEAWNY